MLNDLIGKNKELGRFLFCERYTLPPVKNAMYIAEGQDLKRGAVVDVNGVLVGTNSLMPYAVLEFDCDTRDGGKEASVFIKGEFNFDKLYFADGLDQSDLDNIVYNGSGLGIVIKPYEYAEGFSPLMVHQSSNLATEYAKTTYPAKSYVMHDGVLYTNPTAIGTAEDWNPAHWTQTTVAEMIANSAPKWTHRTVSESIAGGQSKTISVQEHEIVDLTVMRRNSSGGSATLNLNLYGECYVFLDKGSNTVVRTYNRDSGISTTDSVFGTPEFTKDLQKAVATAGSGIPEEWNQEDFYQLDVCGEDAGLTISKPSLTSTTQDYAILHYLGDGKLIITPKP